MIDTEREGGEAETQAEGEAGSMQGAWRGTWSQDPRIAPWAKGRCQTAEPPRDPNAVGFDRDCIKSVDSFWWYGHFNNIFSPNAWA